MPIEKSPDHPRSAEAEPNREADRAALRLQELEEENFVLKQELEKHASSYWGRLRTAIVERPFSLRKPLQVAYLLALVAAPRTARPKIESSVARAKRLVGRMHQRLRTRIVQQDTWPHDRPLVSVMIPCCNSGSSVFAAVNSVLEQTFHRLEVMVVDGGSTDPATVSALQEAGRRGAKVYRCDVQASPAASKNYGVERARGKYICVLQPDGALHPTYLKKTLFLLETYQYEIVSTSVEAMHDGSLHWAAPARPSLEGMVQENQFSSAAVFSKKLCEAVGGFRASPEISHDDAWDLWARMMASGARAANLPEPLFSYPVHQQPGAALPPGRAEAIRRENAQCLRAENFARSRRRNAEFLKAGNANVNLTMVGSEADQPQVLFALPYMVMGGGDVLVLAVAEHLKASGFAVSAFTTRPPDKNVTVSTPKYQALTREIYDLYRFLPDEHAWRDFVFFLIESQRINVLFLAGCAFVYELLPELKRRLPRVKVVDQLFNEFGQMENNRRYARFIDVNIVTSAALRDILIQRYGESGAKVQVIVNGVDVERQFNPALVADANLTVNPALSGKFLITFAGRFSAEKSPEKFVEIAEQLKGEPNLHFLMLGDGPEYARVKCKIRELGLSDRIYAPGFVETAPWLKRSGALVVCSRIEGTPLVLMEGLSLGVPVVASRVGGIPTFIQHEYNGLLCDPADVDGFCQAILRIVRDGELRGRLQANAREYAVRYLSLARMKREYGDLLSQLAGKPARHASPGLAAEEPAVCDGSAKASS